MISRAAMGRALALSPRAPMESFVLEVHTGEPASYLDDLVGMRNVEQTQDEFDGALR